MMRRRALLGGLLALGAPAIVRTPGLLMPVKRLQADDGVALLSASHPVDDVLALQTELEATYRAWQRARMAGTTAPPYDGMVMYDIAQEGQAVDAMALMAHMQSLEKRMALAAERMALARVGRLEDAAGAGLPFAAPADWDPSWWAKQVAGVGA